VSLAIEAFNLFERQLEWVRAQPKGTRSRAVRHAIDFYHHNRVENLMNTRAALQEIVLEQDESLKVARQVGGRRLLLAFLVGHILAHALYLLEY
jgi:hypothetical protein